MRTKILAVTLAGTLGLTGAALLVPGIATAATEDGEASGVGGRLQALKDALQGLVTDGTLNQSQADKVATTLAEELPRRGPGGRRHGHGHGPGHGLGGARLAPAEIAAAIGITADELRTQHQAGRTLAEIAEEAGVSREALVDKLVAAAEADLAEAVAAGRLTQAEADERKSGLETRLEKMLDRPGHGPGHAKDSDTSPNTDTDTDTDTEATPTPS